MEENEAEKNRDASSQSEDASSGREHRRNPRFPNSSIWSEEEREAHRKQRDRTIRDAGLKTDRGQEKPADEGD